MIFSPLNKQMQNVYVYAKKSKKLKKKKKKKKKKWHMKSPVKDFIH